MDKTRTLPPLVRGRVRRILEFFVDKIKFFRNILLLTDNFDLVLQVQWWGESLPALIRPKELQIEDRILKNSQSLEYPYHSEKYEIKTTSELLQSYLKTCEVLELSVLEAVENYVIGSAFLRNLINLLKNNNELISVPIFDYLGEEIGEVIIHINFLEMPQKKFEPKPNKSAQLPNYDYSDRKSKKDCDILSNSEGNYLSLGEKILFYDGCSSQRSYQEKNSHEKLQPQIDQFDFTKNKKTTNLNLHSEMEISKPLPNQKKSLIVRNKTSSESLPNIKILSDSSKVLHFDLNSKQSRPKTDIKNIKVKVPDKFSFNSIKCKSKSKYSNNQTGQERKSIKNSAANSRNFLEKPTVSEKEKQFNSKVLLSEKPRVSEVLPENKQTDVQSLSSKETSNTKVLDFLFGCDMSKDSEERALNDFKKMSLSHNLVDSISELCLVPDNNLLPSKSRLDAKSSVCVNQTHLMFDFNNPIERDYYEKFFSESNSSTDFEVAEFLNQPENSLKLGRSEFYEAEPQKKSQVNSLESCSKFSLAEEPTQNSVNEDYLVHDNKISDRAKSCGRCKYYKKLSELDTIIESLKHFEQKMIMHEKNSQNLDAFIRRNQLAEGS